MDSKASLPSHKVEPVLATLKETHPHYWALAIVSLYGGGLRWGSVTALQWTDIDEDREVVLVRRSHDRGVIKDGSKTGHVSTIPLEAVKEALDFHKAFLEGSELHEDPKDSPWIFATGKHPHNGRDPKHPHLVHPSSFNSALAKACETNGIGARSHHSLRNTFVSLAGAAGTSQAVMESMTGHSSQMSAHYTTVGAEEQARLIEAVRAVAGEATHRANVKTLTKKAESLEDALDDLDPSERALILAALERQGEGEGN